MSWCRVCFEHDCGIDHGDRRVRKIKTTRPKPKPHPRKEEKKGPTKKAPSHTQLKLF